VAIGAAGETASLDVIGILMGAGADANALSVYGESVLKGASHRGRFDIVRFLLERGARPDSLAWTSLMVAIAGGTVDQVAAEIRQGADLTATETHWKRTPWLLACHTGEVPKADILLRAGADLGDRAHLGRTALMLAVIQDNVGMLKWLLDHGADTGECDDSGTTPLMEAARNGSVECVRALLCAGADPCALDKYGESAICHARTAPIAQLLVDAGCDIDHIHGMGYTLLWHAVERRDPAMVRALLAMGAEPVAISTGDTALHRAVQLDELESAEALLSAGANVNAQDIDGWTPLFGVASVAMASLLLQRGADPFVQEQFGDTALDRLAKSGDNPAVDAIIEHAMRKPT
jgi:ankyrin repeat protein